MPVDPVLLEILACPECRVKVELEESRLLPGAAGDIALEDDIPIMLLEEAEPPPADWQPREG